MLLSPLLFISSCQHLALACISFEKGQISFRISFIIKKNVNFAGSAAIFAKIPKYIQLPPGGVKKGTRRQSRKWGFSYYRDTGAI